MIELVFQSTVIEWRGPAPFYFAPTPEEITHQIEAFKKELTYGWGVIPAQITIGGLTATTSLIPRLGSFYVPIKNQIRLPLEIVIGQTVDIKLVL